MVKVESKSKGSPMIASSSPPPPNSISHAIDGSPTVSRPATAVARTLSQLGHIGKGQELGQTSVDKTPPSSSSLAPAVQQHTPPMTVSQCSQPAVRPNELPKAAVANSFEAARPGSNGNYHHPPFSTGAQKSTFQMNDDEEEGIDLVK